MITFYYCHDDTNKNHMHLKLHSIRKHVVISSRKVQYEIALNVGTVLQSSLNTKNSQQVMYAALRQ